MNALAQQHDGRSAASHSAELALRTGGGPYAAATARRSLEGLEEILTPETLGSLRLLVTELVTNSVRHAHADAVLLKVQVREDELVRVEVHDPGSGFDADADLPGREAEGGWGLFLVDRMSDRWGVGANGGTVVWLEIDLGPTARAPA